MVNDQLKALLAELKLSQRQFANRINLDPGYFSRIMQGKSVPPKRILLLIATIFHVNLRWLESGEGDMFSDQKLTLTKRRVFELVDTLSEDQAHAVLSFIQYLKAEGQA